MEYKATIRYLHMTPRKLRRVVGAVAGQSAELARARLTALPQRASHALLKLLNSAAANAREQDGLATEALRVKRISVGVGPKLRRFMPRAFGRANRIEKRMSHVSLVLEGEASAAVSPRPRRPAPAAPVAQVPAPARAVPRASERPTSEQPKRRTGIREFGRRIFRRKAI